MEKWIIKNGEIVDTETNMTFDSFMEILTVLNGQSKQINKLECLLKRRTRQRNDVAELNVELMEQNKKVADLLLQFDNLDNWTYDSLMYTIREIAKAINYHGGLI